MTKISVITICYNEPDLEKTCQSIINQSFQDFEWIVIDGGSKKETLDIFDKYKKRIDKFVSEPDKGVYDAYNKGIKIADGEYIIFMNAGDAFYSDDVLTAVYPTLESDTGIIYGETFYLYKDRKKQDGISCIQRKMSTKFFVNDMICTQSIFIKKDIFISLGLFNEKYRIAADYEKLVQYLKSGGNFKYVPIVISAFDKNGISNKAKKDTIKEVEQIQKQYFSKEELELKNQKEKFSFLEKIFSVKNSQ